MKTSSFSLRAARRLACVLLAAAMGACQAGDADSGTSNGSVEEVDRSTERLAVGTLTSANGTYGTGCTARSGSWSARISGSGALANPPLSVVQNDSGCALTLTELVATATYSVTPSITMTGAYQGTASAVATGSSKFYANAKLSATTLAADFVITLLYSDDPGAAVGSVTAAFAPTPTLPSLVSPAAAATVTATPTLTATFSDADASDTGQLYFRVDTTTGCDATPIQSGQSAAGLAIGANGSWTTGSALAAGTYYWCAQAVDARGFASAWTATRSFVVAVAPPAFVASTTANSAGAATLAIAKPAGTLSGMVMIAAIANADGSTASLAGWTSLGHSTDTINLDMFYRVAGAAEPASYTFTLGAAGKVVGGIMTISGSTATPIDVIGTAASSATAPSITTTMNDALVVGCWANAGTLATPPATMTARFDLEEANKTAIACATEVRPTAGATGTRIAAGAGTDWTSRLVSIRP